MCVIWKTDTIERKNENNKEKVSFAKNQDNKKEKENKKETKQIEQTTTITLTAEPSISRYFARGDRLRFP